jgi:peptidoglycan/xylan/chitin deacetylase (PgdA/CDA1 family)
MKAIMYHYVREADPKLPYFKHLHIEDFRKQLDYFQKELGFVPKEDFLNSFKTGIPVSGVILTFDDGFSDHYQHVLPELIKRNLWGIFYIPYKASERKRMFGAHIIHLLLGTFGGQKVLEQLSKVVTKEMLSFEHVEEFRTLTYKKLTDDHAFTETKRILNFYIDEKYREKIIDKLMKIFFKDEKSMARNFYMNEREIRELSRAGMMIGAHTVNHPVMSKLNRGEQEKEILPCFEFIEKTLGKNTRRTYCHPYGGHFSFNANTEDILNKSGCLFSFNVEPRDIEEKDLRGNRQALPRYDCNMFPYGQVRT